MNILVINLSFVILVLLLGHFLKVRGIMNLCFLLSFSIIFAFALQDYIKTYYPQSELVIGIIRLLLFIFGASVVIYYFLIRTQLK